MIIGNSYAGADREGLTAYEKAAKIRAKEEKDSERIKSV